MKYTIWDIIVEDENGKLYRLNSPIINENFEFDAKYDSLEENYSVCENRISSEENELMQEALVVFF